MQFETIKEAAEMWVRGFNAFPYSMIEQLMQDHFDEWTEITLPSKYDRVNYWDAETKKGTLAKADEGYGEIVGKDGDRYIIEPDEGKRKVYVNEGDFEIIDRDGFLPMWGTLWQFGESVDDWWLEEKEGLQAMSDCGFRIYEHEEWGYFFGIDGAGYDFYEAHWIPLYKARGLHWHKEEEKTA